MEKENRRRKLSTLEISLLGIAGIAAAVDLATSFAGIPIPKEGQTIITAGVHNLYALQEIVQQVAGTIAYGTGALWGYLQVRKH